MKQLICAIAIFFSVPYLRADLQTSLTYEQAKDDVRIFLKQIYKAESSYMAEYAKYATQISDLSGFGFTVPAHIMALGKVSIIQNSPTELRMIFQATHPVFKNFSTRFRLPTYEINQSGVLRGLSQWNTAAELINEVEDYLKAIANAEAAYFVEYNKYSTDFNEIGVSIPDYLKGYGSYTITINDLGSFQATFTGSSFPLIGYGKTIGSLIRR